MRSSAMSKRSINLQSACHQLIIQKWNYHFCIYFIGLLKTSPYAPTTFFSLPWDVNNAIKQSTSITPPFHIVSLQVFVSFFPLRFYIASLFIMLANCLRDRQSPNELIRFVNRVGHFIFDLFALCFDSLRLIDNRTWRKCRWTTCEKRCKFISKNCHSSHNEWNKGSRSITACWSYVNENSRNKISVPWTVYVRCVEFCLQLKWNNKSKRRQKIPVFEAVKSSPMRPLSLRLRL